MARYQVTAIRMSGGIDLHHVTDYFWSENNQEIGHPKAGAVLGLKSGLYSLFTKAGGSEAEVTVVPDSKHGDYLRSSPDNSKSDNLLSLPRK